jgi:hypothetical protein
VFASLAQHVLAAHPVPRFLEAAFADVAPGSVMPALYAHLGRGGSWRTAHVPWLLTRRAAHVLATWTDHSTPIARAFRSAQLAAVNAPEHVVTGVLSTTLARGAVAAHEPTWLAVFAWLSRQPGARSEPVAIAVREIAAQLAAGERFDVKGRTLDATVRTAARRARDDERFAAARAAGAFPSSGIAGAELVMRVGDADVTFRVREIANGAALAEESRAMRNCVVTYVDAIAEGEQTLFSVVRVDEAKERHVLTFEVNVHRREVTEALGVLNRAPTETERAVLVAFAAMRGLTVIV